MLPDWNMDMEQNPLVFYNSGMTDKEGKYEASDLKNLGDHKFSTTFTILSVDLEEVNKDHFLLVKGADKKKKEYRYKMDLNNKQVFGDACQSNVPLFRSWWVQAINLESQIVKTCCIF